MTRIGKYVPFVLVFASTFLSVAFYLQALNYPFISDDIPFVVWNSKLAGLQPSELWRLLLEPYNDVFEFLPLRDLSLWVDMKLFGLTPAAFRIHNIFLYLFCLPLIYLVTLNIWRYFRPADSQDAPWAAAIVTAIFALHPALVESVVWISGRKYMLPNLFALITLWFAVSARRAQGLSAPYAIATLVAFVAMMLSKSSFVTVAPLVALLWILFWRDTPPQERQRIQLSWPLAILLIAVLLTRNFMAHNHGFDSLPFYFGSEAFTRSLSALGWLARLSVSPENRHFFYPVFEDPSLPLMVAAGTAVIAAASLGMFALIRHRSLEAFVSVAFLLFCIPYLQLIPHGAPSLISDRYLVLAVWPIALLIVSLLWRLSTASRITLLLAIAISWGWQSFTRPRDWRNFETLVEADSRAYPGYYMPAANKITSFQLPRGLVREATETAGRITTPEVRSLMLDIVKIHHGGDDDAVPAGKLKEAMALLWKLGQDIKHTPSQAQWNSPLNNLWQRMPFLLALEWKYLADRFPDDASLSLNAGLWNLDAQRYEDAARYLSVVSASQRLPLHQRGPAYHGLGQALLNTGHVEEAETALRSALEQTPSVPESNCLLADIYQKTGRINQAKIAQSACRNNATE